MGVRINAKGHRERSLQNRLVLLMQAILLSSILILALYVGSVLRDDLRGRLRERQLAVATLVAADIDEALLVRWNFLKAWGTAISSGRIANPPAIQSFLDERRAALELFDGGFAAFSAGGEVIAQSQSLSPALLRDQAHSSLVRNVIEQGRGRITPLARLDADASLWIAMTIPIRDPTGAATGALVGVTMLNLPHYVDNLSPDHAGVDVGFFIVVPEHDGFTTLIRNASVRTELSATAVQIMLDRLAQDADGTFTFVDPSGAEVIAFDRLVPSANWHLVATMPTGDMFELMGNARRSTLLVTLLLMLASGLLMRWVLRRELAPMRVAAMALKVQSDAHEPARPLSVHRHDEIGRLISGFNEMLETLGKRELALRESEDRYRLLVESATEAIWVLQDGGVKFANAAMTRAMGTSDEELRSRPFAEFLHPDCREPVKTDFQACIEGSGDGEKLVIRVCASGGGERWLEACGVRISWDGRAATLCFAADVTEQRQVKQELAEASNLLERTSELAQIGGWRLDVATRLMHWMRETYRIHDVEVDQPISLQHALSFYPAESRAVFAAALQSAIDTGQPWDLELPLVTAQGRSIWVRSQGAADSRDGKIVAIGGAFQDVTARRQMESQILQSEKMAAIGQLAAGVAHEINNPIAFVNSNLGALRNYVKDLLSVIDAYEAVARASDSSEIYASVDALKTRVELDYLKEDLPALLLESVEGLERVKNIVVGLKDFARADATEIWQLSDLRVGIESTLKVVWNELKYKCEIINEFAELPLVECMPGQLNQVFMNLLVNAAHAIPERGIIRLRTGQQDASVWVEVKDTGQGIDPAVLPRIFDPFFTTKPAGKGTGLGLSVSIRIIERHNGRFEVESVPGEGTTFRVWLPIRQIHQRETMQ